MEAFKSGLLVGTAFAAFAALAGEAAAQQRGGAAEVSQLQELVVTAQRREERLQEVPIAITAISGEQLDKSRDSLRDVLNKVPGVFVVPSQLEGSISIRGVVPRGSQQAGAPTAGYYLDSSPFALIRISALPDADIYDLDRIEVLKGPQGTLYGAASSSGVIRVLTHDADLNAFETKMRGALSTTKGGEESYRADGAVNIPLVEGKLAVRGVLSYEDIGGFIDRPNKKDGNDGRKVSFRIKANAAPTEDLTLGASVWIFKRDIDSRSMGTRARTSISTRDEPEYTDIYLYALKGAYDFGPVTLSSDTSYLRYKFGADSNYNAWFPGFFPRPETLKTRIPAKVFTQEVGLASDGEGAWRWNVGGIYRRGQEYFYQHRESYVNINGTRFQDKSRSFAVFGEVTRVALDGAVEVTGGLRYFKDKQNLEEFSRFTQVVPVPPLIRKDSEYDAITPRVVVKYKPSEDLMAYASYSQGFRSGFAQSPAALSQVQPGVLSDVKPDRLHNYEVGAKGDMMDGRLSFEVAGYFIDWQDVQDSITIAVNNAGTPINIAASVNGSSASGFGFDLGLTARPVEGLTLSGAYSWNDLTIDADVRNATGVLTLAKGDRLQNSPKATLSLNADYVTPVSSSLDLRLSGSVNRASPLFFRTLINGVSTGVKSDAITLARASVAIESSNGWSATFFGENLFDTRDSTSRTTGPGLIPELFVRLQPRTFGVQLERRF